MMSGFTFLKQLSESERDYIPTCAIYKSGTTAKIPTVVVELRLPSEITDGQLDELRIALSKWAKNCGFGELAEEL